MSQASKEHPDLECECGSTDLCVCSTMPVFLYVSDAKVVRVVVPEEYQRVTGGVVRCLSCERFWILDDKQELEEPADETTRS
jgi:hypothetical protein